MSATEPVLTAAEPAAPAPRPRDPERNRPRKATSRPKAAHQINRRRPTLPGPFKPSTIGAEGLNFSVRNGKRCFPLAIATESFRDDRPSGPSKPHSRRPRNWVKNTRQALEQLVPVG